MASDIKDKFSASAAFAITVEGLADAGTGSVGRQSTMIDNSVTRYQDLEIFIKLRMGAVAATANSVCEVFLIRSDKDSGTPHRSDNAGPTNAAITILNAPLIGSVRNKAIPVIGDDLYGEFVVHRPGPEWGIAVVNRSGQTLDVTPGDHWARWIGLNPEVV